MVAAAQRAADDKSKPDPQIDELILESLKDTRKANWGPHSLRRKADKGIRDFLRRHEKMDGSKEKVNMQMGWDQANMEKDMAVHYDEEDLERRLDSAAMTAEM